MQIFLSIVRTNLQTNGFLRSLTEDHIISRKFMISGGNRRVKRTSTFLFILEPVTAEHHRSGLKKEVAEAVRKKLEHKSSKTTMKHYALDRSKKIWCKGRLSLSLKIPLIIKELWSIRVAVNHPVGGSNPSPGATKIKGLQRCKPFLIVNKIV